jgi:hypothetical protein
LGFASSIINLGKTYAKGLLARNCAQTATLRYMARIRSQDSHIGP